MRILDAFRVCYLIAINPESRCNSSFAPKVSKEAYDNIIRATGDVSYIACKNNFWNKLILAIGRELCLKDVAKAQKDEEEEKYI